MHGLSQWHTRLDFLVVLFHSHFIGKNAVPTGDVIKDWDIREDEKIYFLLRSEKNKFTIGLGDILECLRFAEKEGEVPKLPVEWWGSEYGQTIT